MDLTPYVDSLRRDLLAAASGAGEEARQVAERLGFALEPATRLALMEAVSQAAAEITAEMRSGSVDVRLAGRDLDFVVEEAEPVPLAAPAPPVPSAPAEPEEEGGLARVTLRLPESVKDRAEEAAGEAGQSLNTWLVNVVRSAVRGGAVRVDVDLTSLPFLGRSSDPSRRGRAGSRRVTGWL